jgi:diguanylate cyclase (GGDEF)-like protein
MRIVLAEASRTDRELLTRLLEARGHMVKAFADGPEALHHIAGHLNVDALMASADLPSMSGMELCWETRLLSSSRRPIYIILMASERDRGKLIEALDSGADDFISTPPRAEELYARLRAAERLAKFQHELIRLAITDPLTNVFNRRAFFERAKEAFARASGDHAVHAIMLDIDHFKQVNDVYGHAAGDEVLRAVAREVTALSETVGRLGGEEFAVIVEGASDATALDLAEELRLALAALEFNAGRGSLRITGSLGISSWAPGDTVDTMLKRADVALYKAKNTGRNRVIVAGFELSESEVGGSAGVVRATPRGEVREASPREPQSSAGGL